MPGEQLVFDPVAEATGAELTLDATNGIDVRDAQFPPAKLKQQWATSADTEGSKPVGEAGYDNAQPFLKLRVTGSTSAEFLTRLGALTQKLAKIQRKGGTLRRTVHGSSETWDLYPGELELPNSNRFLHALRAELSVTFQAKPFARGTEAQLGATASETTKPVVVLTADAPGGDVDALGRAEITDTSGNDQWLVAWGLELVDSDVGETNLVTNPSFEVDTAGWVAEGTVTIARNEGNAQSGDWDLQLTNPGVALGARTDSIAVTASRTYTAAVYVKVDTGVTMRLLLQELDAANASVGTTEQTVVGTGSYVRVSATRAFGATGVNARVIVRQDDTTARSAWIDAAMLVEASTAPDYFDGDSDGAGWTGTAHASTSEVGFQTRHFFEAEDLTPLGGAAVATRAGGSPDGSAASNVVAQGTLTPNYQAMLSLKHAVNGLPAHVGDFNVWVRTYRPTSNSGEVSVAFEWAVGDFSVVTRNSEDAVTFDVDEREGALVWVKLGQVHLPEALKGTQQWDGRFISKSTVTGDDLELDCVWLQPIADAAGELRAVQSFETPTSFSARDEFGQTSGALAGKVAPVGGTWAGAGDADDFQVETTGKTAQRTAVSDADQYTGRFATIDALSLSNVIIQADVKTNISTAASSWQGVLARYVDTSNWLAAAISWNESAGNVLRVVQNVAGTKTTLISHADPTPLGADRFFTIRCQVNSAGTVWVWFFDRGAEPGSPFSADSTALATGGALASGEAGIYDAHFSASALTRNVDNFQVFVPAANAAVFANQSLEVRDDGAIRENAAGAIWTPITPEGDLLTIPPAGREAQKVRMSVLTSRTDPDTGTDPAIDDKTLALFATPRYFSTPQP